MATGEQPMDAARRRELARRVLDGYASGPDAPVQATADALVKIDRAVALVLVEGVSDQIAVETAAAGRGWDFDAERVAVVPIGGAHATGRFLTGLGPLRSRVRLAGLCDLAEADIVRRGLAAAGVGTPRTRTDLADLGFFVCVDDLEDELIRALGVQTVETVLDSQGDLGSFRTLQGQPAWRDRRPAAQLRRFMGSGSRRKSRYARLLVEAAVARDTLPRPLDRLLAFVRPD
ncbi:TOPRIM nucleotidyl transferase/hydrolase domain-containing protein [Solwaraspora sp. WMMD792]|uniref:TOPRIM nucleotidyl transferase/hydrolase domain-containing protein n=1 Tax=Solwaraspora sp. WMMD792 TaxID=3016099 RepID=UPI0024163EB2|nr:TOPRIM nucleotidyl transferase/hydrolase domain-containing protein [Solwaraspora sp. WMMD792]MDG4771666.1 ATP-dependent endonuclease [Solwaraspora sp. WMMD792]